MLRLVPSRLLQQIKVAPTVAVIEQLLAGLLTKQAASASAS
jgi:hypothetical protein